MAATRFSFTLFWRAVEIHQVEAIGRERPAETVSLYFELCDSGAYWKDEFATLFGPTIQPLPRSPGWRTEWSDVTGPTPFDHVTCVNLSLTSATDVDLRHLAAFPELEELWLVRTRVTDAGIPVLCKLKQLKSLYLDGTEVSDVGLQELRKSTSVTSIGLRNTRISDAGLVFLGEMTQLRRLSLGRTAITDAGLQHLDGLKQLEELSLYGTSVTNECVNSIQRLSSLRWLDTYETNITLTSPALQLALPGVAFDRD